MTRPSPLLWLALVLIFLVPTAAGRVLIDLAGGLALLIILFPLLLGGVGWIGWRILKSRMVTCEACGVSLFSGSMECPLCGSKISSKDGSGNEATDINNSIPASSATIDVIAKDPE